MSTVYAKYRPRTGSIEMKCEPCPGLMYNVLVVQSVHHKQTGMRHNVEDKKPYK